MSIFTDTEKVHILKVAIALTWPCTVQVHSTPAQAKGISAISAIGPLETHNQQAMPKLNFYLLSQIVTHIVVSRKKILFFFSQTIKKQARKFSYSSDAQRLLKLMWCLH